MIGGFGLVSGSISGEYNHLKNRSDRFYFGNAL
jgi:hypothetical protein